MNKKNYLLAFFFALSICLHAYLANNYYQLKYQGITGESACNISNYLNCDAVTASNYSSFLNIPVALWGFSLNLVLFILLIGLMMADQPKKWLGSLQLLSVISALGSVVMLAISFLFMSTLCPFCLILHVLAFLQLLVLWTYEKPVQMLENIKETLNFKSPAYAIFVIVLLCPLIAVMGHQNRLVRFNAKNFAPQVKALVEDWELRPEQPLLKDAEPLITWPAAKAKFEIVEFADFFCHHCKNASAVFKLFLRNYDASLKFFAFPLDRTCNSLDSKVTGPSCLMAKAVYCANAEDKGWEAHDWIFQRQGQFPNSNEEIKERFNEMIQTVGLKNTQGFQTCLEAEETHTAIVQNSLLAQELKLTGTPTIFVNGKLLRGGQQIEVLKAVYSSTIGVDK